MGEWAGVAHGIGGNGAGGSLRLACAPAAGHCAPMADLIPDNYPDLPRRDLPPREEMRSQPGASRDDQAAQQQQ
ncbi:hypothetical protein [Novosphingobium sp.]|uniref:hypothetical protein n=1 Tax=Novosphingobium sp. TaxID=1874826 RepID=UPI0033411FF5